MDADAAAGCIGEDIELADPRGPRRWASVKADPGQIEQVIMNLVVNARDAMPDGGRLTIETAQRRPATRATARARRTRPGPHVMLAVSDTGSGMDAETRSPHLRALLHHQGAGQGHRPRPGHGLRDRQAERRLIIESTASPGEGTTFKIYFPRVDAPPEDVAGAGAGAARAAAPRRSCSSRTKRRSAIRGRRSCASDGYTVLEARDGGEALAALPAGTRAHRPRS